MRALTLTALEGLPEIERGMRLGPLILDALAAAHLELRDGDVVVVAQKVVSKAEGRLVRLADITPGPRAKELAESTRRDARVIELMLRESREIVRATSGVIVAEHRLGFVMANAGIDQSNVSEGYALLLPEDPDGSARRLRDGFRDTASVDVGVVINDSFGRAWRNGVCGVAIGVAGIPALVDLRGAPDRASRPLEVTHVAAADELAAAASLVMGQAAESVPAVHARGFPYAMREASVQELIRPRAEDLFR